MSATSETAAKLNVPDELREMLLDFTIGYLLDQPSDIVDYAIEFFDKLKKSKLSAVQQQSQGDFSDEDDASDIGTFNELQFFHLSLYGYTQCSIIALQQ
jgi:cAMP-dependent protein kinase regulator